VSDTIHIVHKHASFESCSILFSVPKSLQCTRDLFPVCRVLLISKPSYCFDTIIRYYDSDMIVSKGKQGVVYNNIITLMALSYAGGRRGGWVGGASGAAMRVRSPTRGWG
jgi:hypothetical protein